MPQDIRRRTCKDCGAEFTFYAEYYRKRRFDYPKRCSRCAKLRHSGGGRQQDHRECLVELDTVFLDISSNWIQESIYLRREDRKGRNYISCLRMKLGVKDSRDNLTVYDYRNTDPRHYQPLEGMLAFSSVRIMRVKDYDYIVLEETERKQSRYRLSLYQQLISSEEVVWRHQIWSSQKTERYVLALLETSNPLGGQLCQLSQKR